MPSGIEQSLPVKVLVSLRTWRNDFLIRWFLREQLAIPVGIESEHTSKLGYPVKLLLNLLVPEREVSYA